MSRKPHSEVDSSRRPDQHGYLETPPNVVDGDESLAVSVNDLEPLDVGLNLFFAQVDRDLVPRLPVHHLAHFRRQELRCHLELALWNVIIIVNIYLSKTLAFIYGL